MSERLDPKKLNDSNTINPITRPSDAIAHFTGRKEQKQSFSRLLHEVPDDHSLPVLVFYGIGGVGKSWLLSLLHKAMKSDVANTIRIDDRPIPSALISLEGPTGRMFIDDPMVALAEIRRQLSVNCMRFDLAYEVYRQQLDLVLPQAVQTALDIAEPIAGTQLPGWSVVGKKVLEVVGKGIQYQMRKKEIDSLKLLSMKDFTVEFMLRKLALDLHESLPKRNGKACRAVIFIDTFEKIRESAMSTIRQKENEAWLRILIKSLSTFCLVVVAGQNRVDWKNEDGVNWSSSGWIEQHYIDGLAKEDAEQFLTNCGVNGVKLREAILQVCSAGTHRSESVVDINKARKVLAHLQLYTTLGVWGCAQM
jgi:hypothetical protein